MFAFRVFDHDLLVNIRLNTNLLQAFLLGFSKLGNMAIHGIL
jgi:hypothetical protein